MKEQVRVKGEETRMIGSHIKEWRDWKSAAEASLNRKAISRDMLEVVVPPFHGQPPMKLKAKLVVELDGGRMTWVFHSANSYPIEYLPKATARDIDRVVWWRAW